MMKQKGKGSKKLRKRASSWTDEDVIVHTSLPPKVDGQLRCFLKLCVREVIWLVANAPELTHVRVVWWGEDGNGTIFRPIDVRRGGKKICQTTARYAIRSGAKQFAAYLNDLNSLTFDLLSGSLMVPVGRTQIETIGQLAPNRPIDGLFPVFSADGNKIADLKISLSFQPIMASYESVSSAPPTDVSLDFVNPIPVNPPKVVQPLANQRQSFSDPFFSPQPNRSGRGTPSGIDAYIYGPIAGEKPFEDATQNVASPTRSVVGPHTHRLAHHYPVLAGTDDSNMQTSDGGILKQSVVTISSDYPKSLSQPSAGEEGLSIKQTVYSSNSQNTLHGLSTFELNRNISNSTPQAHDALSSVLERGNKLRDAMIISTLSLDKPDTSDSNGVPLFLSESRVEPLVSELIIPDALPPMNISDKAIDLMLGNPFNYDMLLSTDLVETLASLSDDAEEFMSELGDAQYDQSLLNELFYKHDDEDFADEADVVEILDDPGNMGTALPAALTNSFNERSTSKKTQIPQSIVVDLTLSDQEQSSQDSKDKKYKSTKKKKLRQERKSGSRLPSQSGSKKKKNKRSSRSHSRSRSGSERSMDSDSESHASESSKVSFDPPLSDAEDCERMKKIDKVEEGLSVERLTLLGRVQVARVAIQEFVLKTSDDAHVVEKTKSTATKGKPPRPVSKIKMGCTFFVEYNFPVCAASRDKQTSSALATEIMRAASKKVTGNIVNFSHRSVFPVSFDGNTVDKWWTCALVFKVYSKGPGQKVPQMLGSVSVPLRAVLTSDTLGIEKLVQVADRSAESSTKKSNDDNKITNVSNEAGGDVCEPQWPTVGNLKISIELSSESKDFGSMLAKTRMAEARNPRIIPLGQSRAKLQQPVVVRKKMKEMKQQKLKEPVKILSQTAPMSMNVNQMPFGFSSEPSQHYSTQVANANIGKSMHSTYAAFNTEMEDFTEPLTLHMMIQIPEGKGIAMQGSMLTSYGDMNPSQLSSLKATLNGRDSKARNCYLVCRMFWCDDIARSQVCWGNLDPQFGFSQMAPVLLTKSLLERMRNNFMIIEVWDKKTSSENDHIVGIVKLPLHQFYLSYRDRRVAASLLRSQMPVVSVDSFMPIVNPFTGQQYGSLKVVLALGSVEQVNYLDHLQNTNYAVTAVPERPRHFLERQNLMNTGHIEEYNTANQGCIEHMFEVSVAGVHGLKLFETMVWGEADCFVQYHFPAQQQSHQEGGRNLTFGSPQLKAYHTSTTLCVPDLVFTDTCRHKIILPENTPVQREILSSCAGVGGGTGGVLFELWCRFYHPNVRDQLVAKALLPLSKLCALITMQHGRQASAQTHSLPLTGIGLETTASAEGESRNNEIGILDVSIGYQYRAMKSQPGDNTSFPKSPFNQNSALVCLCVNLSQASGLQAAAKFLATHDANMKYPSEVGVNCYASLQLSFLPREEQRLTRSVARTFAPVFSCLLDFPCPLLWTDPGQDALCLADMLEKGELTVSLYHQISANAIGGRDIEFGSSTEMTGRRLATASGSVLIGTVSIPLVNLLKKKTGLRGWYSVMPPVTGWLSHVDNNGAANNANEEFGKRQGLQRVVGGIELSLNFAHQDDIERVMHAARGVGWSPEFGIDAADWEIMSDDVAGMCLKLTVNIDHIVFPLENALRAGQTKLETGACIYVRYKIYNRKATFSKLVDVLLNVDNYLEAAINHQQKFVFSSSSAFLWFLREEVLEIQVWLTVNNGKRKEKSVQRRDKLIGSAYVELCALSEVCRQHCKLKGAYPLFKPGSSSLGGAFLQAQIAIQQAVSGTLPDVEVADSEDDTDRLSESDDNVSNSSKKQQLIKKSQDAHENISDQSVFSVHLCIERALHLPEILVNGSNQIPSCYVGLQSADSNSLTCTPIIVCRANPIWNYERDVILSKELLSPVKGLVFKVWHKINIDSANLLPDKDIDRVIGFVSVDLSPLTAGLKQLSGWYNIVDFSGICQGQLKVSIVPNEPITGIVLTSALDKTEDNKNIPPITAAVSTTAMSWLPHFTEHIAGVQRCHNQLQEKMAILGTDVETASRSLLFDNLRSNMRELDEINSKLKQKLTVFSSTEPPVVTSSYGGLGSVISVIDNKASSGLNYSNSTMADTAVSSSATIDSIRNNLPPPSVIFTPSSPLLQKPPQYNDGELSAYTQTLEDARKLLQRFHTSSPSSAYTYSTTAASSHQNEYGFGTVSATSAASSTSYNPTSTSVMSKQTGILQPMSVYKADSQHATLSSIGNVVTSEIERKEDLHDLTGQDTSVWEAEIAGEDDTYGSIWEGGKMGAVDLYDDNEFVNNYDEDDEILADGLMGSNLQTTVLIPRPLNDISSVDFERFQTTANEMAHGSQQNKIVIQDNPRHASEGNKNVLFPGTNVANKIKSNDRATINFHYSLGGGFKSKETNKNNNAGSKREIESLSEEEAGAAELQSDDQNSDTNKVDEVELLMNEDPTRQKHVSRQLNLSHVNNDLTERKREELRYTLRNKPDYMHDYSSSDEEKSDRLANYKRRPRKGKAKLLKTAKPKEWALQKAEAVSSSDVSSESDDSKGDQAKISEGENRNEDQGDGLVKDSEQEPTVHKAKNSHTKILQENHDEVSLLPNASKVKIHVSPLRTDLNFAEAAENSKVEENIAIENSADKSVRTLKDDKTVSKHILTLNRQTAFTKPPKDRSSQLSHNSTSSESIHSENGSLTQEKNGIQYSQPVSNVYTTSDIHSTASLIPNTSSSSVLKSTVPNFFLPPPAMEQAMRSLRSGATSLLTSQAEEAEPTVHGVNVLEKIKLASKTAQANKLSTAPSNEQRQRIAKIFAQSSNN